MKTNLLYDTKDVFAVARDEAEVDNLLNNDVYKFLMLDFILEQEEYKDLVVKWEMKIRNPAIKTTKVIDKWALTEQLNATKDIVWASDADLSYMRWILGPSRERLFSENTLEYLRDFKLPDYTLGIDETDNYTLSFEWKWADSMMWEIFWLKIINTLYNYSYIKKEQLSKVEFSKVMTEMMQRLYTDIATLKTAPDARISEFGTRRWLSTDYQRMVNQILSEWLWDQFIGTSNVLLAKEAWGANPIGTNAHELRMIPTALSDNPFNITKNIYEIDSKWQEHHKGLGILLPDTYGSSFYFENCPTDIAKNHDWIRLDSKDPMIWIPEYIDFLIKNDRDPMDVMAIPSDGLTAEKIVQIQNTFRNQVWKLSYGWWTNATNNSKGTWPRETENMWPFGSFSVVIKPTEVQRPDGTWMSTVKLSDNPWKHIWEESRLNYIKGIFGNIWVEQQEILV